ncbi:MAG: hydrolase [Candidatus Sumerlaeota bacterium]|nr:hydrolase [Candidatus Sumerlaeota bacterium]
MPFTPYHFGPNALIALPLQRHIDLPVFLLVNVTIDIEPLIVLSFNLNEPLHGISHTFLFSPLLGFLTALLCFFLRHYLVRLLAFFRLSYFPSFFNMVLAGVLGAWLHVFLDAPIYQDIKPFFPFKSNPLFNVLEPPTVYLICALCFLPAIFLYILHIRHWKRA